MVSKRKDEEDMNLRGVTMAFVATVLFAVVVVGSVPAQTNDIRKIDFKSYTFESPMCAQAFKTPSRIRVTEGVFRRNDVSYQVGSYKMEGETYADLLGDGKEEAIVPMSCELQGANDWLNEILIYGMGTSGPVLLARLDEDRLRRDYRRYYPVSDIWSSVWSLKVQGRTIELEKNADGPHCCPKWKVRMSYGWNGRTFVIAGKPGRRPAG